MKRRNFLKLSAVTAAATSLEASKIKGFTQFTNMDVKDTLTINRFGIFYAHTQSGEVTKAKPFEKIKYSTPQINAFADRIQNETRVEYPMVRKSYLEAKGPSKPELRGKEEFVRVSWDTALDLVANELKKNHEKYGSESVYGECYWWGGSGKVSWGRIVSRRMMTVLGGFVAESGDYSTGAGLVIMPHVLGDSTVYNKSTKWKGILENAKHVVFWGTDPLNTNQISSAAPMHSAYQNFVDLKAQVKAGKIKAYSIDAKKNDTQRYYDSKYIEVRPNTDTAMMMGMAYHLYENKLYDKEFIRKYTVGFNKFKKYLAGEVDGVKKTPEWAEEITTVPASEIKKLAETLRKEKSLLVVGRALQRQDHGEQQFWMVTVLAAMLGHIGQVGCGVEFGLGYNLKGAQDRIAPSLKGISQSIDPKYNKKYPNGPWIKGKNIVIPSSRGIEAIERAGEDLHYDGKVIKLPKYKIMYNASSSWFTRHQNVNNMLEQWKKVDTVVTADPFWTFQSKMSDIVLPVATELERTDINQTSSGGEFIVAVRPIVEPAGESKSDYWICKEICKRWGYEEVFTEGKTEKQWAQHFYEDAAKQAKGMGVDMPSFDKFWAKGYVQFPKINKDTENYTRLESFVDNPYKNKLGTPSGKIEIYSPTIAKFKYDDCKGHPTWIEPIEWLGNKEKTKKYPLHIVSPHSRYRLHSQLNNSLIRGLNEVSAREPIIISSENAKKRGIKTGDIVRVFNDRGETLAGALVSDTVRKDVCILHEGAWYSPEKPGEKSLCQHGNINVLTIDKGTSKLAQSNIAHTALVEIEKYKGEIKPITAFNKPVILQS